MAGALPTSLLVDMPERQQVDVALTCVETLPTSLLVDMTEQQQVDVALTCVDVEMKKAVLRARLASLEDWWSDEARATTQATVVSISDSMAARGKQIFVETMTESRGGRVDANDDASDEEVTIDEIATAASAKLRRWTKR